MSLLSAAAKSATTAAAPWIEMVRPFWPLIWRLALAGAIFWAGWHYGGREAEADLETFKVAQAKAAADAVAQLGRDVADRDTRLRIQEIDHVQQLNDLLLEQATTPPRVVRVCPDARAGAVPRVPAGAGAAAADAGGAQELQPGAGFDIGSDLKRLVDRADRLRVKCIAQEERADQLAAVKPSTVPVR